ncbi:MAG: type III pantothenate kinase [Bacteroidetes bacterium CG12_big_fil_rev_8_21_14_0_65_60_17]|nr:MAG: type III pantothenate kinase [Bacteroidetes bacterium CG12_big_fil_rev_8_21_14_0_65_60_17]
MILVLDIGNSAAKAGLWDGQCLVRSGRVATPEELDELLLGNAPSTARHAVEAVGAVSVVPARNDGWIAWVMAATGKQPVFFTAQSRLPFRMLYETPDTLGADRVAAAVGAWRAPDRKPGQAALVVDAGTALNMELVLAEGAYVGGVIAPGPELMRRALSAGTAQLPLIPLSDPGGFTGASTEKALQSGVMNGFATMARGLLDGLLREAGVARTDVFVAATGGWAPWLAERLDGIDEVRPDLVLEGVAALVENGMDA